MFEGTIVTLSVPGGPLDTAPVMVKVRVAPAAQVPAWVQEMLIATFGASSVPAQPSAVTRIARSWSRVKNAGLGR
jgi:hypothetical protein